MLSLFHTPAAPLLAGGLLGGLGMPELIVILVVVLIIFGPQQLPKIGRAIGASVRELKDAASRMTEEEEPSTPRPPSPKGTVASTGATPESTGGGTALPTAPKDESSQKLST